MSLTVRDAIRNRSRNVGEGGELPTITDKATRRLVVVQLNLVSNCGAAMMPYNKLEEDYDRIHGTVRQTLLARCADISWESGSLLAAVGEAARQKYSTAVDAAAGILLDL